MKKVVLAIDPGHGMGNRKPGVYDPGAVGASGNTEAAIVLQYALALKYFSKEYKVAVHMTRQSDSEYSPLGRRDDVANSVGATHFLSIHCNAGSMIANGTETYYRDEPDKRLARVAQDSALASLRLRDRGLKSEASSQHTRLSVFGFNGPCCLLELGFISNGRDLSAMLDRDKRIAFCHEFYKRLRSAYA